MPKILILSSNPRQDLNLNREVADVTSAIQRVGKFEIRLGLEVRAQELPGLLTEHSPQVVHFCGHGAGEEGLVFQDENGRERFVSTEVLARLFKTFSEEVNCVVLNACDSDQQADAIVAHINYVVGMSQPILDKAAYYFATGFYQGLAAEKSIEQAYELGCLAIQIWSEGKSQSTQSMQSRKAEVVGEVAPPRPKIPEYLKPVLRKKSEQLTASAGIISVQEVLLSSASPDRPPGFEGIVRQEIDRKEYKDHAREAYDNFGRFSTQNTSELTKSEYKQRRILLGKVKKFWIKGFLQPSLQGIAAISLDLKARPDAIADLSQGIEALSVELDASYERLKTTQIYGEMGQGRTLLILGSPGAGKTIVLLQLAQRLSERSEKDLSLPIPVVLNLSSWAKEQKAIVNWLIDELQEKYQVPKSLSEPWIRQQQLIFLLDGLDEVKEYYRSDCIRALNKFIGLFPQTEVAVCSRVRDYEVLTERLQISSALCIQPLASQQVYQFLDSVGGSLKGLKSLLKRDVELEQFAQNPLTLSFMSVAYQGWSVEKLILQLRSTTDRYQHLFDTYIDRRLERGTTSDYSKEQVLYWLIWLASRMVQEKQTIFLIEKMQPTWLRNRSEGITYQIRAFMISGLIGGLTAGLIGGLGSGLIDGLSTGLSIGLSSGLSIGLILGIMTGFPNKISPLEKLSWSWQEARSKARNELFKGIGLGLLGGLIFGLIFGIHGLIHGVLFGLIFGLIFGLFSGLGSSEIEKKTVPNQEIRNSRKNCLIIGLFGGLVFGLLWGLVWGLMDMLGGGLKGGLIGGLTIGLIWGPIGGLILGLKYGGAACIQHFTLRQMLYQKGHIPWNYAKFLDFTSNRFLMKKVGGGYIFFHRMLLEHFAQRVEVESPLNRRSLIKK